MGANSGKEKQLGGGNPRMRADGRLVLSGFVLLGALAGFFLLHPMVITLVWFEFVRISEDPPGYWSFMRNHAWKLFDLRNFLSGLSFAALGGLMGWIFTLLARSQLRRAADLRLLTGIVSDTIPELIAGGENAQVEFKSSLRWDVQKNGPNKALEAVIAKTIAGFLNAAGGTLLIGVADDGCIFGLEQDYATLRSKDRDGFELLLQDLLKRFLGGHVTPYVHAVFGTIEGKDVCRVIVEPAPKPVYLTQGGKAEFLLRSGNSTRLLDVRETMAYAAERWP